jgi:seryl-tRNA synthetase
MEDTVRWTIKVSRETDTALRRYLAQRGMKKGDISKFVEEAVRWRVLDRVVSEVMSRNTGVSARKIQATVDAALAAVRAERLVPASR